MGNRNRKWSVQQEVVCPTGSGLPNRNADQEAGGGLTGKCRLPVSQQRPDSQIKPESFMFSTLGSTSMSIKLSIISQVCHHMGRMWAGHTGDGYHGYSSGSCWCLWIGRAEPQTASAAEPADTTGPLCPTPGVDPTEPRPSGGQEVTGPEDTGREAGCFRTSVIKVPACWPLARGPGGGTMNPEHRPSGESTRRSNY